jgi:hypothetical protein
VTKTEVTCDHCGKDVTNCHGYDEWRLLLTCEQRRYPDYNMCYDPPSVRRDHHFCGLGCLRHWLGVPTEAAVDS